MFKRKKKKTGVQTPEFRKPTSPPPPPTSGSNAVKPNPNYTPPASIKKLCPYKTPCGWCTKWDKKCDKKIPACQLNLPIDPCSECIVSDWSSPNCKVCLENNYRYFKTKEK